MTKMALAQRDANNGHFVDNKPEQRPVKLRGSGGKRRDVEKDKKKNESIRSHADASCKVARKARLSEEELRPQARRAEEDEFKLARGLILRKSKWSNFQIELKDFKTVQSRSA
jgi:hypothetical protein